MELLNVQFRTKPYAVLTHEALFRNLKPKYRNNDFINSGYLKELAGYRGERDVDYKISLYPLRNSYVIQGIRLRNGPHHFQIDTLILTRNLIIILEVKNIKGELEYDPDFQQLTQKVGTEVKGIKNPIFQVEAQKRNLEAFLHEMNLFNIPIEYLVVISDPKTILRCKQQNQEVFDKMIHAESLPLYLDKLVAQYQHERMDITTLQKLHQHLLNNQSPHQPQLLKKFAVNTQHLIEGIPCPNCQHYPMIRANRKWFCTTCQTSSKDAHIQVILDYFLLHKTTITNKECRKLLHITSKKVAYRLLMAMNLKWEGDKKGRKYFSPYLHDFPQNTTVPQGNYGDYIWKAK